jgi:N-acetylmuramoyl-L-alanine amidase
MRNINEIIVHCAATPEGKDFTVSDIDRWHKKRGWSGIGYHYVVYRDGSVHKGRPVWKVGAHVRGRNRNTIGICYIGGVDKHGKKAKDTRTNAQKVAMTKLLTGLLDEFPKIKLISGHNQYAAKACPSFNAKSEYKHLLVRNKKPLATSRTMQGGAAALVGGSATLIEPVKELTNKLADQQTQLASGDFITVAIGAVIVLGALYALYARWDDAGRPKPWA